MDVAGERRVVRAAVAACALIVALTGPRCPEVEPSCPAPQELRAVSGATVAVACTPRLLPRSVRGPAQLLFGRRLDLNRADAASLQVLPNVGPSRAAAIVAERSRRPFRDVADLTRVRGIGPRTVAGLADWVEVSRAAEVRAR